MWSTRPDQRRRWLPEAEAQQYAKKKDWVVKRWGRPVNIPSVRKPPKLPSLAIAAIETAPPSDEAVHITALMEARKMTDDVILHIEKEGKEAEEAKEDTNKPQFVVSRGGIAHRRSCSYQPKTGDWAWTLEEASRLPVFKRYCRQCIRED